MNLKEEEEEEENLDQGEKEAVEKGEEGEDNIDKKVDAEEEEEKVSNDNVLPPPAEGACAEQPSEEKQPVEADFKSEIKEKVLVLNNHPRRSSLWKQISKVRLRKKCLRSLRRRRLERLLMMRLLELIG